MPTYEYECTKCKHEFEVFQSITAKPLKKCPKCQGAVRRKIGAGAGLIFKGSGFYITDYRSEGYHKAAKSESGHAEKPASDKKSAEPKTAGEKPAKAPKKAGGNT